MSFTVHGSSAGFGGSISQSQTISITAGHSVVVAVGFDDFGGAGVVSVIDSDANVYTLGVSATDGGSRSLRSGYFLNLPNSITSVTALATVGGFLTLWVWDISASGSISFADSDAAGYLSSTTTTADALTSGTLTIAASDGLILGACLDASNSTVNSGTGFSTDAGASAAYVSEHKDVSTSAAATFTATSTGASAIVAGIAFEVSGGGSPAPTITDVDTDESITSTQTNVVVTGTDFDTATVDIEQGAVTVGQSIDSQSATSIQFDVVFDSGSTDLKHGAATLRVTNVDAQDDSIAITITPPSGQLYVDIVTPAVSGDDRLTTVDDIETDDQIHARGLDGGAVPAGLSIYDDGTFGFASGETPTAFEFRPWDVNDATWGAWATQSIGVFIDIGLVTETDTVTAFARFKSKALGLNTETDSALAITVLGDQLIDVGQATETDSLFAFAIRKALAIGLNTEVDSPIALSSAKLKALSLNTESDSAFVLSVGKLFAIGFATETSSAFAIGRIKRKAIGLAQSFDNAFSLVLTAAGRWLFRPFSFSWWSD